MYNVDDVLATMEANAGAFKLLAPFLVLSGYVQMIEAIRLGFAHRSHAIPLFAIMYIVANDVTLLALYPYWFGELNNAAFKVNYWMVCTFFPLELVVLYQVLRFSREEVFNTNSLTQALMIYAALQAGMFVLFWWLKAQWGDPLFLVAFVATQIVSHIFNIPMLLRRGSRKGQSLVLAGNLVIGAGVLTFFFGYPLYGPQFRTLEHYLLGVSVTLLGLLYVYLLYQAPAYSPRVVGKTGGRPQSA